MEKKNNEECKHISELNVTDLKRFDNIKIGQACKDCGEKYDGWVCLICGYVGCEIEGHGKAHCASQKHSLLMRLGNRKL